MLPDVEEAIDSILMTEIGISGKSDNIYKEH